MICQGYDSTGKEAIYGVHLPLGLIAYLFYVSGPFQEFAG